MHKQIVQGSGRTRMHIQVCRQMCGCAQGQEGVQLKSTPACCVRTQKDTHRHAYMRGREDEDKVGHLYACTPATCLLTCTRSCRCSRGRWGPHSLMCTWSDTHAQVNMFVGEIGHVFPQLSIHTHSASSLRCA